MFIKNPNVRFLGEYHARKSIKTYDTSTSGDMCVGIVNVQLRGGGEGGGGCNYYNDGADPISGDGERGERGELTPWIAKKLINIIGASYSRGNSGSRGAPTNDYTAFGQAESGTNGGDTTFDDITADGGSTEGRGQSWNSFEANIWSNGRVPLSSANPDGSEKGRGGYGGTAIPINPSRNASNGNPGGMFVEIVD